MTMQQPAGRLSAERLNPVLERATARVWAVIKPTLEGLLASGVPMGVVLPSFEELLAMDIGAAREALMLIASHPATSDVGAQMTAAYLAEVAARLGPQYAVAA